MKLFVVLSIFFYFRLLTMHLLVLFIWTQFRRLFANAKMRVSSSVTIWLLCTLSYVCSSSLQLQIFKFIKPQKN